MLPLKNKSVKVQKCISFLTAVLNIEYKVVTKESICPNQAGLV